VLAAIRGGADVIAHTTPQSGPWDETILAAMKERRVALIPTLTIFKYYMRHDRISAEEQIANAEIGQLRAWLASGGTVLFGTDIGAIDYDPSEEYALMGRGRNELSPDSCFAYDCARRAIWRIKTSGSNRRRSAGGSRHLER